MKVFATSVPTCQGGRRGPGSAFSRRNTTATVTQPRKTRGKVGLCRHVGPRSGVIEAGGSSIDRAVIVQHAGFLGLFFRSRRIGPFPFPPDFLKSYPVAGSGFSTRFGSRAKRLKTWFLRLTAGTFAGVLPFFLASSSSCAWFCSTTRGENGRKSSVARRKNVKRNCSDCPKNVKRNRADCPRNALRFVVRGVQSQSTCRR